MHKISFALIECALKSPWPQLSITHSTSLTSILKKILGSLEDTSWLSKNNKDLAEKASYGILEPHRRSTSSHRSLMSKISFALIERALDSLGHGLSSASSVNAKDILPIKLRWLEADHRWGSNMLYDAFSARSLLFLLSHEASSSDPKIFSEY